MHSIALRRVALAARRLGAAVAPGAAFNPRQRHPLFVAATGAPFDKHQGATPPPDGAHHKTDRKSPDSAATSPAGDPDLPVSEEFHLTGAVRHAASKAASSAPSGRLAEWLSHQRAGAAINDAQHGALLQLAKDIVREAAMGGAPAARQPALQPADEAWRRELDGLVKTGSKIEMQAGPEAWKEVPEVGSDKTASVAHCR